MYTDLAHFLPYARLDPTLVIPPGFVGIEKTLVSMQNVIYG